jgi:hypothetical protein
MAYALASAALLREPFVRRWSAKTGKACWPAVDLDEQTYLKRTKVADRGAECIPSLPRSPSPAHAFVEDVTIASVGERKRETRRTSASPTR